MNYPKSNMPEFTGAFPQDVPELLKQYRGGVDYINMYSLLQCVYDDGGKMLIGDIPDISKRKRFFSSGTGIGFHKDFMKTD